MEEAATPLPREETTPPVTKIYFGAIQVARVCRADLSLSNLHRIDVHRIMFGRRGSVNAKCWRWRIGILVSWAGLRRRTGECEVAGWLRFFVAREVKRRSSG
jgi:hypothetical protein